MLRCSIKQEQEDREDLYREGLKKKDEGAAKQKNAWVFFKWQEHKQKKALTKLL